MKLSTDRILTTHTGSLHRPPDLEELYRRKFAGEPCDENALETRLRSAVAEVVRRQADIGIDVIDDGELSKLSFWAYARSRLDGVETRPISRTVPRTRFSDAPGRRQPRAAIASGLPSSMPTPSRPAA